jgi:signal peptidase I
VRRQIQEHLNDVRHLIEDEDAKAARARIDEVRDFIEENLAGKQKSTFREYAESIGLAVLFALFLRAFVIEAFKIPTGSMIPTLLVGDHLFVNKFTYGIRIPFTEEYVVRFNKPKRGEVVVFKFPTDEAQSYLAKQPASKRGCIGHTTLTEGKDFIKRIVGVEGDTVALQKNRLVVNGRKVPRTFLKKEATGIGLYPKQISEVEELGGHRYTIQYRDRDPNFGPIKVKPNHVFVMGDNRDDSSDGRCWGQVPVENLKGRAMIIWWSSEGGNWRLNRIGQVIH